METQHLPHQRPVDATDAHLADHAPPIAPGLLTGVCVGAFFDGIVFHQVLRWHHFVSSTDAGAAWETDLGRLEHNVLWDGIFHAASWLVLVLATVATWRAWRRGKLGPPASLHGGLVLAGWGAFNLVDGVLNHTILAIHHLRDDVDDGAVWDLGYLGVSAVLLVVGLLLARRGDAQYRAEADRRRQVTVAR